MSNLLFGNYSQMKKGEIHFYEKLYIFIMWFPLYTLLKLFVMKKRGRSNDRLLTWKRNVNIVLAILFILMLCAFFWLYLYASYLIIMSCQIAKLLFMLFMFDYIILSILNILLEVSKLEYFLNSKEYILRGSFLATLVSSS